MASSTASPAASTPLAKGTYSPAGQSDLRSPCPMVNSLANHGFIPRNGREVHVDELAAALKEVGLSPVLRALFSNPIFLEHRQPNDDSQRPGPASGIGRLLRDPWAVFAALGMRRPGQTDSTGQKCLNLDQLALPDVVEHDISLSRFDHQQGDNISMQPDLVRDLLASSSDSKTLTLTDLAELRKRRIARQNEVNPGLHYGPLQHRFSCAEIALILTVLGDGDRVPCDYVRALFQEERLPIDEGWKKRQWSLGLLELLRVGHRVKLAIGIKVDA